ncbi:hypothetical protein QE152_g5947 [Popillia japonica]|uniref:Uncharacterized protein n=1 Tax=Popillia japonica TaxID=7064 RepID=A0AAW1MKA3_POPJA
MNRATWTDDRYESSYVDRRSFKSPVSVVCAFLLSRTSAKPSENIRLKPGQDGLARVDWYRKRIVLERFRTDVVCNLRNFRNGLDLEI